MGNCSSCCSEQGVTTNELVFHQDKNKNTEPLPPEQEKKVIELHSPQQVQFTTNYFLVIKKLMPY